MPVVLIVSGVVALGALYFARSKAAGKAPSSSAPPAAAGTKPASTDPRYDGFSYPTGVAPGNQPPKLTDPKSKRDDGTTALLVTAAAKSIDGYGGATAFGEWWVKANGYTKNTQALAPVVGAAVGGAIGVAILAGSALAEIPVIGELLIPAIAFTVAVLDIIQAIDLEDQAAKAGARENARNDLIAQGRFREAYAVLPFTVTAGPNASFGDLVGDATTVYDGTGQPYPIADILNYVYAPALAIAKAHQATPHQSVDVHGDWFYLKDSDFVSARRKGDAWANAFAARALPWLTGAQLQQCFLPAPPITSQNSAKIRNDAGIHPHGPGGIGKVIGRVSAPTASSGSMMNSAGQNTTPPTHGATGNGNAPGSTNTGHGGKPGRDNGL